MKPKFKTVLTALLLAVSLPSMAATRVLMETDMGNIRLVLDESKASKPLPISCAMPEKAFTTTRFSTASSAASSSKAAD